MLVRMLVNYGENWPEPGATIELDDTIAAELIERGEATPAKPAKAAPVAETATLADGDDTAVVKRKPGRPRKAAE